MAMLELLRDDLALAYSGAGKKFRVGLSKGLGKVIFVVEGGVQSVLTAREAERCLQSRLEVLSLARNHTTGSVGGLA